MADDDDEKEKHRKLLEKEHRETLKAQEKHLKELDKQHAEDKKEQSEHLRQLELDHKLERKLDDMIKRGKGGGSAFLLDGRSVNDQLAEINSCSCGLGRDVQDFLTARQHGWDRAGQGREFAGFGDNQSR